MKKNLIGTITGILQLRSSPMQVAAVRRKRAAAAKYAF